MRSRFGLLAALAGVVLLASCGAAVKPAKYYQFAQPVVGAPAGNAWPVTLLVGRVRADHLLRDDRIVYRVSDVQLGTYEYHRWAEPPTDMVESLLLRTLRDSGRFRSVEFLGSGAKPDYILRGKLTALEEVDNPGVKARVGLYLEVYEVKSRMTVWSQAYTRDEPVKEKTVPAVVEALNRAMQEGLQNLTGSLYDWFAAHPQS